MAKKQPRRGVRRARRSGRQERGAATGEEVRTPRGQERRSTRLPSVDSASQKACRMRSTAAARMRGGALPALSDCTDLAEGVASVTKPRAVGGNSFVMPAARALPIR